MVPEPVTGSHDGALAGSGQRRTTAAASGADRALCADQVSGADHDPRADHARDVTIDRVGPGGGVASDSSFGVALVTLWQQVAEAGGVVGFAPPVVRSEVAARAAALVDDLRTGRLVGIAANGARRLVGVALLRPGLGSSQHTGRIELVLVDPARCAAGLGTRLMEELLAVARQRGLQRLDLQLADDRRVADFFGRFGFAEWGRRPGWIQVGPADCRDEVLMGATL